MNAAVVAPPRVSRELLPELHRIDHRHALRAACFVAVYAMSAVAVCGIAATGHRGWSWAAAPLYLAAAALHGLSLFTHEAVHGSLSRNRFWNALLGAVCAWPVLQNFSAYRVLHLRHHEYLGAPGDPDHYPNYTRWTWLVFLMNWGRLLVGYPVYIVALLRAELTARGAPFIPSYFAFVREFFLASLRRSPFGAKRSKAR